MAIKLKNFLNNNPKVKYTSLALLILFSSMLFETLFNLKYNFGESVFYDFVAIPSYYFFGNNREITTMEILYDYQIIACILGVLSITSFILFLKNRKSSYKLETLIQNITSRWAFETFTIILSILIFIRYNIWMNTYRFFDNPLIFMDIIILFVLYSLLQFLFYNKSNLKTKLLLYKFLSDFLSKQHKKSITKKISNLLMLSLLIHFLIIFFFLICYSSWYAYTFCLFYALIASLPLIFIFPYIYNVLYKKFTYIEYISENVKKIESGDLKYKLEVKGNDEITNLATSINNITTGLDMAVENQIKSEKMKTELITNVSHDLKTPLTSIVNYVDILKNNDLDEETIKNYINILDRKSQRLKCLVEDIFEASKISSGDIELNIEKTDIKELLIQSVVELEDKISRSSLDFIVNTPENSVFTMIDGKKTFRVFANLINNILKYSLTNTRVYLDISVEDDDIIISFKNISSHMLNMKPNEFLERFRRGDVSRNTEGSGLGLSIALNLVSLQGGHMDLFIDGDLFKVILTFKKYK